MDSRLLWTAVILALLVIAVPALSVLSGRRIRSLPSSSSGKLWRYARTVIILWAVTAAALYALRINGLTAAIVGVRPPHENWQLLLGLVWVAVMLVTVAAGARRYDADYRRALSAVVPATAVEWSAFVPVALTAGICEEFLYRGYALWVILSLTGNVWAAVLISSLAFALGHAYQGRPGMAGAFISGVFYASVFLISGSLLPCMLGHFTQDIVGAAILRRLLKVDRGVAGEAA